MEISAGLIGRLILLVFSGHAVMAGHNEMFDLGRHDVYSRSGRLQLVIPDALSLQIQVTPTGPRKLTMKMKSIPGDILAIMHSNKFGITLLLNIFILSSTLDYSSGVVLPANLGTLRHHSEQVQHGTQQMDDPNGRTIMPNFTLSHSLGSLEISPYPKDHAIPSLRQSRWMDNSAGSVERVIAEYFGIEIDQVTDNARLIDLGADTLALADLVDRIEKYFMCEIPGEDFDKIILVIDAINDVNRRCFKF